MHSHIPSDAPSAASLNPSSRPTLSSSPTSPVSWAQRGSGLDNSTSGENLGFSVLLSKDGESLWSGGGGILRLYHQEGDRWSIETDVSTSVSGRVKSLSISSDEEALIAGDPDRDGRTGAAAILAKVGSNWQTKGPILTGEYTKEFFGWSVSISGDGKTVAVGAWGGEYVKLFVETGENWVENEKIEGVVDSSFGISLVLSSKADMLIVGANYANSVFVYSLSPFSLLQRLDGDGDASDLFGVSVAICDDGNVIAVGSGEGNYMKLYRGEDADPPYRQIGETIRGTANSNFGYSVALSGNGRRLAVGTLIGKAFVYAVNANDHKQIGAFVGTAGDWFGNSVSLSDDGKRVAIGGSGLVLVFESSAS